MRAFAKIGAFLLGVALWTLTTDCALADKRIALILGNSNYLRVQKLPNPANDAKDMADTLRALNFEVIYKVDADRRGLDGALEEFERKAVGADTALFFFAGHGLQYRGRNYLLPIDADLEDEVSLRYNTLAIDKVRDALDAASGVKIMILDACRNNPLSDKLVSRSAGLSRSADLTRGLARLDRTEGMVVAYATQADQVAQDGNGRNSPFSSALIHRLQEPNLEIATLFRRVAQDVYEQTSGKQRPELSISLLQDFYLNLRDDDSRVWRRIGATATEAELQDFIQKYPSSAYVRDAQSKLYVMQTLRTERETMNRRLAALEAERKEFEQREQQRARADQQDRDRRDKEKADQDRLAIERRDRDRQDADRRDAERLASEKREADRLAAERLAADKRDREQAELKRLAAEKLEKDRIVAEKREQERQVAERAAAQKLEKEKQEAERVAADRREKERLAQEALDRQQALAAKAAAERVERERVAAEKREQDRLKIEQAAAEKREKDRLETERVAAERRQREQLAKDDAERKRLEAEHAAAEKADRERLAAEKRDQERKENERLAAEKREKDRLDGERLAAERVEKERVAKAEADRQRIAAEHAAAEKAERDRQTAAKADADKREADRIAEAKRESERMENERIRIAALEQDNARKAAAEQTRLKQEEVCSRERGEITRLQGEKQPDALRNLRPNLACPGLVATLDKSLADLIKAQELACRDDDRAMRKIGKDDVAALKVFVIGATCDGVRKSANERIASLEADFARKAQACMEEGARFSSIKDKLGDPAQARGELTALQASLTCDKLRPDVADALKVVQPPAVNTPDQIKLAQIELRRVGCYWGGPSGTLNADTKVALKSYLEAKGSAGADASINDEFLKGLKGEPIAVCKLDQNIANVPKDEKPVASRPKSKPAVAVREETDDEAAPARKKAKAVARPEPSAPPPKKIAAPRVAPEPRRAAPPPAPVAQVARPAAAAPKAGGFSCIGC